MKIIENTTVFCIEEETALAIGKFDGIHLGHQALLKKILEYKEKGLKTAIFTFDIAPLAFFTKHKEKDLATKEEKYQLLKEMGVDYLVVYPFCNETAQILPEVFLEEILLSKMNAKIIVAGEDVSFGYKGKGDAALLKEKAKQGAFEAMIIPKITYENREISSTFVREEVAKGNMELVNALLGRPYSIMGIIELGNQLGRKLGLPTINLYPDEEKLLPPNGVYFSQVELDGKIRYGVTNIGTKPTVSGDSKISVETYLFDFNKDVYGKDCKVTLLHFDRGEQRFGSIDVLKEEIEKNVSSAKAYFKI